MGRPTSLSHPSNSREKTLILAGIRWMKYNGALIPANAMPEYVNPTHADSIRLLKDTGALFIRYSSVTTQRVTNWWNMVCREYHLSNVSPNTRSKIRRGQKRFRVQRSDLQWLSEFGYECHVESYKRYKYAKPDSRDNFKKKLLNLAENENIETWVGFKNDELMGYILCQRENKGVFMHTIDLTPVGLHDYIAYAMIHEILEYYINQIGVPVTNGNRAISHQTDIQDFLIKFGFEREYGELRIVYRPIVGFIVRILYPFRHILRQFQVVPIIHKVFAVLQQEELHRKTKSVVGLSAGQRIIKRTFDIIVSFSALLVVGWFIIICWILATIDCKKNGIFTQKRIGKDGKPFSIFKIRTMRAVTGFDTMVTREGDPRITKLGSIFRKFKLDELPQLLNVFLGDMSFVGPRPDVASFTDTLKNDDRIILSIRPGITGPSTLAFRHEEELLSKVSDPEKYNLEVIYPAKTSMNKQYIKQYSFIKDLYYVLATLFPRLEKYVMPDKYNKSNRILSRTIFLK